MKGFTEKQSFGPGYEGRMYIGPEGAAGYYARARYEEKDWVFAIDASTVMVPSEYETLRKQVGTADWMVFNTNKSAFRTMVSEVIDGDTPSFDEFSALFRAICKKVDAKGQVTMLFYDYGRLVLTIVTPDIDL